MVLLTRLWNDKEVKNIWQIGLTQLLKYGKREEKILNKNRINPKIIGKILKIKLRKYKSKLSWFKSDN
jgi:hypothetical protein